MIRTSYFSREDKPDLLTRDHRGVEIKTGLKIAFNKSGVVVMGTIKEIKKNRWKNINKSKIVWSLDFAMEVENENGDISIIKNPNSFIIL